MKATYNKSEIMKRAWSIYRNCRNMFPTFSLALSRAWEVEKQNMADRAKKAELEANTWGVIEHTASINDLMYDMGESLIAFYANNTYNGD